MKINRTAKKALALAVGGLWITQAADSARAQVDTWLTTGSGNSQNWFTAANWSGGVPTSTSTATFSTNAPPSGLVTLGATSTNVGAIIDTLPNDASPSDLAISGSGTLGLLGQNYTATYATGVVNETNVVAGIVSSQSTHLQSLTFNQSLTLSLLGPSNTLLSGPGTSANGQGLIINGNIVDGPGVHAALQINGGGNASIDGGTVFLAGNSNSYSGGTVVGNANETDAAALLVNGDAVALNPDGSLNAVLGTATGSGNVTINDGSQLWLNGTATDNSTLYFMNTNQTLTINGIGLAKNVSGAIRTNAVSNFQTYDILANVVIGTISGADEASDNGIVLSPTSVPTRTVQFSGVVSNLPGTNTGINKQGSGNVEFSNPNNTFDGFIQIGNGDVTVDPGSSMGSGDLILFQTGKNTAFINFFNAQQTIGNLSSGFTTAGTFPQNVNLYGTIGFTQGTAAALMSASGSGTTLALNQTQITTFGLGTAANGVNNTSTIDGPGNLELTSASTGTLTLSGANTYTGFTTINGGTLNVATSIGASATGTVGDVTVNSGGALSSGNNVTVLGTKRTSGFLGGTHDGGTFTNLIVNSGGVLLPGGNNLAGTLFVGGNLIANPGAIFDMDLIGGTNAQADQIDVTGALTVTNSSAVVNVLGSKLAFGNYTLFNVGSLTGNILPGIGSVPNAANRQYSLVPVNNSIVLEIVDTGTDRFWSVGGSNPPTDGSGTWSAGGTNFFVQSGTVGQTQVAYSNASTADLIIGNSGGGGTITLGSNVTVGGPLVFSPVSSTYAISGTNSLQLNGGIISSNTTTITAPVVLGASQSFTTSVGTTLTISNGISQTGGSQALTTGDQGTILIGGTSSYTGGTTVSQGTLQITTASLPAAGGVQIAGGANLVFSQASSGNYGGAISGSGGVTINNTAGAITLSNTGNTYTGPTTVAGGTLSVNNINELGGGLSSLILGGGTLQFAADGLDFPGPGSGLTGSPKTGLSLAVGASSVIDTNGHDVTMNQSVSGAGNITKIGQGNLTWTGLPSTTVLGTLGITAGTLTLSPIGSPSFGFALTTLAGANTFTGDLTIGAPMDLRLQGGYLSGGGKVNVIPNGINIEAQGGTLAGVTTNIGNVINVNPTNISPFNVNIFATAGNTMNIIGGIQGQTDVDFSGGSGTVLLSGASSYTGITDVDTGPGKVMIGINNALPVGTDVHVTGNGTGSVLDLNGMTLTVGSIDASSSMAKIENDSAQPATLVIVGTTDTTYSGLLQDGQQSTLGLTLGAGNVGSLSLDGANQLDGFGTGLSGPINIIAGRLNIQNLNAIGDPQQITVGATANDSQLRFNGLMGTLTFTSLSSPDPTQNVAPPIVLAGLGGYTPIGVGTTFDPGAINAGGGSNLVIPDPITLAATSGIQVGQNSTLTLTNTISGPGGLVVTGSGTLNLTVANTYGGPTTISGSTVNVNAAGALPAGSAVANNSFLNINANTTLTQVTGTGGLTITNSSTLQLAGALGASTQGAVAIGAGSTLDITTNKLVINYGAAAADPINAIVAAIVTGYNGGNWQGTGLLSSAAAANPSKFAVGYIDGNIPGDTIAHTVGANQIIVKYTLAGDAFLENTVGFDDLVVVAQNFGFTGLDWAGGNFNYDPSGSVGFADLVNVAQNFGFSSGIAEGSSGGGLAPAWEAAHAQLQSTVVAPEPASLALVAAGAAGLLARRKRR